MIFKNFPVYDRRVARRPSDVWRERVEEEAAEIARGELSPDHASAAHLWSDQLVAGIDVAALAARNHIPDGDITGGRDW